jgi:Lanthionine synthetase C-like protein
MAIALAEVPPRIDAQLNRLLRAAGELIWRAGPLAKGCGLCHGTAGNGYAFLKLHSRDGQSVWLERARAFAMHALDQWERMRARYAMGRYTLWTGDLGLALYLWDCIRGRASLPSIDVL